MALVKTTSALIRNLSKSWRQESAFKNGSAVWVKSKDIYSNYAPIQFRFQSTNSKVHVVQAVPFVHHAVRVVYSDGTSNDFQYVWLRDTCHCHECYDRPHYLRKLKTWTLDLELQPSAMWVTDEGHLGVKWKEYGQENSHKSIYHSEWLRYYGKCFSNKTFSVTRDTSHRPSLLLWDGNSLRQKGLPQLEYSSLMESEEALKQWHDYFYSFGFVVLKGVPKSKRSALAMAKRVADIGSFLPEEISDFRLGPTNTMPPADTEEIAHLHTDLVYRERSPGMLMLHYYQSAKSLQSLLVADGFHVANWLHQKHPTSYQILSSIPVPYGFLDSSGLYHTAYWPIIGLDPMDNLKEIHYNNFARQPLQMPLEHVGPFYTSLKLFLEKMMNPASHVAFNLQPGDLISINNQRVLHARSGMPASDVGKYVHTCYVDVDQVASKYDTILLKEMNVTSEGDSSEKEDQNHI